MPIDLDEYRRLSLETWNRISGSWEEKREWLHEATANVNERLVEALEAKPGDTILDLASGTGDTGFLALETIGREGKLISTDFAASMVDAAERVSSALGLEVEHRTLDAEQMDLADNSVDRVVCRFGYMLMADPAAALAQTRRVLRDGGRLSFAVWGPPDANLWAFIPGRVLVERGHMPMPEPGAPGIFALGDPARIRELVTGAGFGAPEIEQVTVDWPYTDPAEHWELTLKLAGPLASAIKSLDPDEQESVRAQVAKEIEPVLSEGATGLVHVVSAS